MAELIKKIKVGSTTYDIGVDINNLEGVRSITTGTANGTINVNTNGTALNVAVKGLQDGAYYPYNNFYNEYYGGTWHQLRMVNSSSDRGSIFYKIADLGKTSGYGTYEAVKITGYMYHHNGNWEQSQTAIIPFQAIVNVSNDTATLYSTRQCSVNWLRLVKVDTRSYELQATCDMAHCDFDIFYQVSNSGSNNCTIYEGQNLVAGTTTGTVLPITNSDNWGNYAYKADKLATARTISLTGSVTGSGSFDGSGNLSIATTTNHSHSYLPLSGGMLTGRLQVNSTIFGYNYSNSNNAAAFIFDKSGANYTGIGANSETDTIYFGACDANGAWVTSYRQKWKFNGSLIVGGGDDNCNIVPWTNNYSTIGTESLRWWKVYAKEIRGDSVYGAVWNDYAEYRDQDYELKPGYITYCDDDGKLKYATERLQHFEGVVSDTFGFAIGETDNCRTPLAVSGRVLVYCDPEDRFHAGDCVCAGPNGIAYRMTREEIIEFPDRIVGTVSEIPTYETWGSGNVAVDGRIWIKVR